ncbi:MAG: ABC transporter ATP-binding protein [Pseudomonadota bacterium]
MPSIHASTEPRLALEGLTVVYGGTPAVDDVSLHVGAGEVLAVVGESGAGKSSIGHALLDLVDPPGSWRAQTKNLDGVPIDYASEHVRGRDVSVIFQDPQTALNPLFTVEAQLCHMVRHHEGLSGRAARERAVAMLEEVGIPEPKRRVKQYPHQFSGGMRQRVVISLAIACGPRVVIADEPTSALDVSVRGQVLDLIKTLARERGTAVLLITHDMAAVARIADRVAVMRYGKIVETGPAERILSTPEHAYAKMLIAAVPPANRTIERFSVPPFDGLAAPEVHTGFHLDDWLRSAGGAEPGRPLLELDGATKHYALTPGLFGRGRKMLAAAESVSFKVRAGEAFGLVGESGSGKSTLAQLVAGLVRPTAGSVWFAGNTLARDTPEPEVRRYRRGLQMVFQDPFSSLNRRLTVGATIAEPLTTAGERDRRSQKRIVAALLERVGLPSDAMGRHPHAFSGGQRQRIALARALAGRPKLLLCDEPTSALDVSIQAQLLNLLLDLKDDLSLTLLFITHDLPVVRQVADRIGVMQAGRLVEIDEADRIFDHPRDGYTKRLIAELPIRTEATTTGAPLG